MRAGNCSGSLEGELCPRATVDFPECRNTTSCLPPWCLIGACLDPSFVPNPWKNMKTLSRHICMSYNTGRKPNKVSTLFEIGLTVGWVGEKVNPIHIHHPPDYFSYRIHLHPTLNDLKTKVFFVSLLPRCTLLKDRSRFVIQLQPQLMSDLGQTE